jgi:hypothetical protein
MRNIADTLNARPFSLYWIGDWPVTANTNPLTFWDIPQTYRHLLLVGSFREAGNGALSGQVAMRFNADSATNYSFWVQTVTDALAAAVTGGVAQSFAYAGLAPSAAAANGAWSPVFCVIPDYCATGKYKSCVMMSGTHFGGNGVYLAHGGSNWLNAGAITRIDLWAPVQAWLPGTYVTLYGLGH